MMRGKTAICGTAGIFECRIERRTCLFHFLLLAVGAAAAGACTAEAVADVRSAIVPAANGEM